MAGRDVAGVRIQGGRQLRSTMRRAGADLGELKAAHAGAGAIVAGAAQASAPRLSGALAASVRSSGTKTAALVRAGTGRLPYAGPIHWGWPARGIAAQPFISDAATGTEPQWLELYMSAIDTAVGKIKGA